jgi:hypothetical protein
MFTSLEIVLMPLVVILLLAWLYQTGKAAQWKRKAIQAEMMLPRFANIHRGSHNEQDWSTGCIVFGTYDVANPEWPEVLEERKD